MGSLCDALALTIFGLHVEPHFNSWHKVCMSYLVAMISVRAVFVFTLMVFY